MTKKETRYSWKIPFFTAAICLAVILFLNEVAIRLSLYYAYKWLDIPFHFLGGFSVGLASIGLLRFAYRGEKYDRAPKFLYTIILTLFVGISWEFVEVYYNVSVMYGGNFWFDTCKDLLMDTLGGILSYICFHPPKIKINLN